MKLTLFVDNDHPDQLSILRNLCHFTEITGENPWY